MAGSNNWQTFEDFCNKRKRFVVMRKTRPVVLPILDDLPKLIAENN